MAGDAPQPRISTRLPALPARTRKRNSGEAPPAQVAPAVSVTVVPGGFGADGDAASVADEHTAPTSGVSVAEESFATVVPAARAYTQTVYRPEASPAVSHGAVGLADQPWIS